MSDFFILLQKGKTWYMELKQSRVIITYLQSISICISFVRYRNPLDHCYNMIGVAVT